MTRHSIPALLLRAAARGSLAAVLLLTACAHADERVETWASELRVDGLSPLTVLPETTLVVHGDGFVSSVLGTTRFRMTGTYTADGGGARELDHAVLAEVVSPTEAHVVLDGAVFAQLCPEGDGDLVGTAQLEVASLATGKVHRSPPVGAGLHCRTQLAPSLVGVEGGSYTLNATVAVQADDVLLGDGEGTTHVLVSGCFLADGLPTPCSTNGEQITAQRVELLVSDPDLRRDGTFALSPTLTGVNPGTLTATLQLVNVHADGTESTSGSLDWSVTLEPSRLDSVESEGASLGGYVDLNGAGFVGGGAGETTEIDLVGSFQPDGGGASRALDLTLIATYHSGELARYVLDEQDSLGQLVDYRAESGTVSGSFTPRIVLGSDTYTGASITGSFRIEPVRQVVYVNFMQGYSDALELFGLRAADAAVRSRILDKARWLYRGLGVELTDQVPDDYVWYAQVDVTGLDPNGLGLMGYDNSPGKDVGNLRLYDHIGGVNALTQQDGYPGFGGIFVESFLAFSEHPPKGIEPVPGASPTFDDLFDPFRPDRGDPVRYEELVGLTALTDGSGCPASGRAERIRCAIYALGNLLGGTMAHELGHSLGLADPGGDLFHNSGDDPNRLMDGGADRPFHERAELEGGGPEVFCQQNYEYLLTILPTSEPDPVPGRPQCF